MPEADFLKEQHTLLEVRMSGGVVSLVSSYIPQAVQRVGEELPMSDLPKDLQALFVVRTCGIVVTLVARYSSQVVKRGANTASSPYLLERLPGSLFK